ncbi:hypothetical protein [Streptomyces sp. NPDC048637]|uniref:hypothetical protein n=1 Tax=Streptomyces sp. NPDC048637 TaxID=3155636 RepID=UPI00342C9D36
MRTAVRDHRGNGAAIASVSGSAPFRGRLFEDSRRVSFPRTPDREPLSVIARQKRGFMVSHPHDRNSRARSSASAGEPPSCEVFLPDGRTLRPLVGPSHLFTASAWFPLSTLGGAQN